MTTSQMFQETVTNVRTRYYLSTPIFWRKLGDGLLGASTFLTGAAILSDYKWAAIACLAVGTIGKFLTNFFKEENDKNDAK